MRRLMLTILGCSVLIGCDPDAAVFVEATIESSSVTITPSGLVTGVSGGIELNLHLGPRASGPGEVTLGAISLTTGDRLTTLVEAVGAQPNPQFPVTVGLDSDVKVSFTVGAEDNLLEADAVDTLCGSGDLAYVVVLDDTLRGGSVSTASEPVAPSGCP
jgi:hypothetical protein